MLKNVFLFTGEERFLLDKELLRRKNNFAEKFWAESVFSFTNENFDVRRVAEAIYWWGLFTTKKLIIVSWIPTDTTTDNKISLEKSESFILDFIKKEGKIPEESLLVFVSYKPDKRAKLSKFLEANTEVKVFWRMRAPQLKKYIGEELSPYTITPEAMEKFLLKVGDDMYRVINEIEKLKWRCGEKHIQKVDEAMIDLVTFWFTETNAFWFLEHLFSNPKKAIAVIDWLYEWWANWNEAAWPIYRWLKQSILVEDIYSQWIHENKAIAEMLKVNPFSILNIMKQLPTITKKKEALKTFFNNLVRLDMDIKSWKLPDTYFWLGLKKMVITFTA